LINKNYELGINGRALGVTKYPRKYPWI